MSGLIPIKYTGPHSPSTWKYQKESLYNQCVNNQVRLLYSWQTRLTWHSMWAFIYIHFIMASRHLLALRTLHHSFRGNYINLDFASQGARFQALSPAVPFFFILSKQSLYLLSSISLKHCPNALCSFPCISSNVKSIAIQFYYPPTRKSFKNRNTFKTTKLTFQRDIWSLIFQSALKLVYRASSKTSPVVFSSSPAQYQ